MELHFQNIRRQAGGVVGVALFGTFAGGVAQEQGGVMNPLALVLLGLSSIAYSGSTTRTIVLVHGAFADGSSWSKVIPILERDGYTVIAVQNPLKSLPDDVATTKRVIDAQKEA